MPRSAWRQICAVLEHAEDVAVGGCPFRVLDVGCGTGSYGVLLRTAWPDTVVDGLDAVPDGVIWRDAYRSITGGVLPRIEDNWPRYDLVLLLDVIEHLTVEDAHDALIWCRRRGPTVVATPNGWMAQAGGEWESHRSGWSAADLWGLGAVSVRTVLARERVPAAMGSGQLVALFGALAPAEMS